MSTQIAAWALSSADAAGVEVAVLLDEGERVALPVLALGLDHVDVGQQQHRLGLRVLARQHRDQAALLGLVGRDEDVRSPSAKPAAFSRAAIRSAASVQLPAERVVLVSTSSL